MRLAIFWIVLGGISFLVAPFAKKEEWFKYFVSAGGWWIAIGLLLFVKYMK